MTPAIALEQVGKTHDGAVALQGVDLSIPPGQFVALVGGSGAGKTTLLKTINALAPPTSGIGYVFQEIGLFPHMSVAENIGVAPALLGWKKDEIAARVDELLDLVDLPRAVAQRRPAALSGGQRQRVGVARALAARPAILLMDEPFGALDPITRQGLGDDVRRLHQALSLTTVMVTHDVAEALLLADRIVVLDAGRIIADAAPRDLMAGHDDPRVEALMAAPRRQAERVRALLDD